MAITNPFTITYGGVGVGGSTAYQLHGPYVIDKSFSRLRVGFDVVVVATSYSTLKTLSDDLETAYRKRDQTLSIDLNGSTWTYTRGSTILNTTATITKTGNQQTDRGYSRSYTCTVEGELPADDTSGLREIEVAVTFEASRQRTVTMRGTYTANGGTNAVATYQAGITAVASTLLTFVSSTATFELVHETHDIDRNRTSGAVTPHVCNFQRQYLELIEDQSHGTRDDTQIKDHRVTFTDLSQHPGDSEPNINRMRRVTGSYDCAIDIEQTTDINAVFINKVRPHLVSLFQSNFNPQVFGIDSTRMSFDRTTRRMSIAFQFAYIPAGAGTGIIEVASSMAYREARSIDYTPVHGGDELAAYADPGWLVLERVWTRVAVHLGEAQASMRVALSNVSSDGWNMIANTSQATPQYIGDPMNGWEQVRVTVVSDTVVERYNRKPSLGTVTPIPTQKPAGPITQSGGNNPITTGPGSNPITGGAVNGATSGAGAGLPGSHR